ncbi:protein translocase subunit SecD [bacterium]|nr:protein translocase subunit SecD [bacterium]
MNSTWKWKTWGTVFAVILSVYLLVPTLFNFKTRFPDADKKPAWAKLFPEKSINLGLDLRGGLYLEMLIAVDEAIDNRIDILTLEIERQSKDKIEPVKVNSFKGEKRATLEFPAAKASEMDALLKENFNDVFSIARGEAPDTNTTVYNLTLTKKYEKYITDNTLKQAVESVRNRIDRYGVSEASIIQQGSDRLIVELPGIDDPTRVIDLIRKTALLEFKMVDDSLGDGLAGLVAKAREEAGIKEGYTKEDVDKINVQLKGKIPEGTEVVFELRRDPVTKEIIGGAPLLLKTRAEVTGDMLRNAQVGVNNNEPHVSLSFNKVGTTNFGELTKKNVGKRLAIVLDGVVFSAPVIQTAIMNGEAQITLGYGDYQNLLKEADDLALVLREGALPATLTVASKTVVGPSLGLDSINQGMMSVVVATVVIIIFMVLYYKLGGIVSTVGLVLNMIFILAIMALLQASLTLPGIAGIVLTLGMAVDANIIIFERMREEIRADRSARAIIENGYGHAMSAIIDSNVTTLIAGVVLYQFGTGSIKGFATTLMIGIVTTMFTAITVTRLIYDYYVHVKKVKQITI